MKTTRQAEIQLAEARALLVDVDALAQRLAHAAGEQVTREHCAIALARLLPLMPRQAKKSPFWWVVKSDLGYYPAGDFLAEWTPSKKGAEVFILRAEAKRVADVFAWRSARVVRVRARGTR